MRSLGRFLCFDVVLEVLLQRSEGFTSVLVLVEVAGSVICPLDYVLTRLITHVKVQ